VNETFIQIFTFTSAKNLSLCVNIILPSDGRLINEMPIDVFCCFFLLPVCLLEKPEGVYL
jgi:hypothetical protein